MTTRAGDRGATKLATGRSVKKSSAYVRAVGAVDELNSSIGLSIADAPDLARTLEPVQQALFDMGAVFAMEGEFDAPDLAELETAIEQQNAALPPLEEFVIPGGTRAAAQLHVSRTICRRAEADLWTLIDTGADAPSYLTSAQYLNRLSDLLFVLARAANQQDGESQWRGPSRD